MSTTCPRHNNVMQFLEVSKNCQVIWLESSSFWKKKIKFALTAFFMKVLKGVILSQSHRRSQRGGPEGPDPLKWNATNDTNLTKSLVFSFSVSFSIFAYNSTRVQQFLTINNIDDQGAWRTPLIQLFPTNLSV